MMEQEDRNTLIEIRTDVSWLKTAFTTHLAEHFRIRLLVLGSIIAATAALFIALV